MADACDSVLLPGGDVSLPTFDQFQCKQPINPHMHSILNRHQKFVESENWPRKKLKLIDPKLIADAGFSISVTEIG